MRDLILVGITAFVSASGAALLTMSLNNDATVVDVDTGDTIDLEALANRVRLLEERTAAGGQSAPSNGNAAAPATTMHADAIPAAPAPRTPAEWRESHDERMSWRQRQAQSRLREAGWSDQEIDELDDTRAQASLDFEQRQYESMRQRLDRNPDALDQWPDRRRLLRAQLGDERYAQLLEAEGRPTTVTLDNVLAGSAGAAAGLRPGDQIRRYGSERVFNERDLMFAILRGEPGKTATLEVERDGSVFHISVPRGPLGISDPLHP